MLLVDGIKYTCLSPWISSSFCSIWDDMIKDKKTSQIKKTQYNQNKQNDNNYLGGILARAVTEETSDQEVEFCWTSGKGRQKVSLSSLQ